MLRSSAQLRRTDPGMSTHDVVQLVIEEPYRAKLLAALRAEPLVEMVASNRSTPIDSYFQTAALVTKRGENLPRVFFNIVSADYFRVLDLPIVRGRNFVAEEESHGLPVAIVTVSTARKLWGTAEPLGQLIRLDLGKPGSEPPFLVPFRTARVVGVVRDVVTGVLYDPPTNPLVFFPGDPAAAGGRLLVRVHGDVETARRTIDADVERAAPGSLDQIHKLDDYISAQAFPMRVAYWVSSAVGAIALLLTLSGIYGVLSYLVTQRTREIGIRMSLGADRRAVARLVVGQSAMLAVVGLSIGAVLALAMTRLISSELQSILTFDIAAFSVGPVLVLAASLLAAFVPARRASRVDPIVALRQD
jgi:hypothetical protein